MFSLDHKLKNYSANAAPSRFGGVLLRGKQKFTYGICPTVVNRMVISTTQVDLCTRSDSSARYGKDPTEFTRHFF